MPAESMETRIDDSPFSASTTDNWIARLGGLPPYIRGVTRGVMKSGHDFQSALAIAIGVMSHWAKGENPWSKHGVGHVTPATQAKATAALAEWEAKKAAAHAGADKREVQFIGEIEVRKQTPAQGNPGPNHGKGMAHHGGGGKSGKGSGSKGSGPGGKGDHAKGHPFYGNQHSGGTGKNPKPTMYAGRQEITTGGPGPGTKSFPNSGNAAGSGGGGSSAKAGPTQAQLDTAVQKAQTDFTNATLALTVMKANSAKDVAFAQQRPGGAATVIGLTNATIASGEAAVAAAAAALAAAKKAAGVRSAPDDTEVRDGMGFIGETGSSGAGLFLPSGPSPKQDAAINKEQTKDQHRFRGRDLSSCDECGQPITAAIHGKTKLKATPPDGDRPGQPIPPVPRQTHFLRHSGPNHPPVSTGHVKGVPARHKKAAYAATQKNYAIAEAPLETAMKTHFSEQRRATVNRLMGKRGGRMLKRAAEDEKNRPKVPPLPEGYASPQPGHYPLPGDEDVTTEEPNTTSPPSEPDFAQEIAEEQTQADEIAAVDAQPEDVITPEAAEAAGETGETVEQEAAATVNPHEIFDKGFWSEKLAGMLQPHLNTAATLAQGEVKSQVGLPPGTNDSHSLGAVQGILRRRAVEAAESITNTTANDLAKALQEGVAQGEGRDAIAKRVNDVFDEADMSRAKQIAQTQTVGAYNEAATAYAQNLPAGLVGQKVWLAHHDGRTRPTHVLADYQARPLNAPYIVGNVPMMFPGDTTAPIGEWINCRCGQAFLPPGMTYGPVANAAQAYIDALRAKPPAPKSPYLVSEQ